MTGQQEMGGLPRRRLLRAAAAGGAGLLGIASLADRAAATDCPEPASYWANADWPDNGRFTSPYVLVDPDDERSTAVWRMFLADTPDDRAAAMARQLLTARLNFQRRRREDPDCVDRALPAYGGRTIRELKAAARAWLDASNWPDDQPDWIVDGVDGRPLYEALATFNHAELADLACNCTELGSEGGDDWENPWPRDDESSTGSSDGREEAALGGDRMSPWR